MKENTIDDSSIIKIITFVGQVKLTVVLTVLFKSEIMLSTLQKMVSSGLYFFVSNHKRLIARITRV
jgi:hypothetical protein